MKKRWKDLEGSRVRFDVGSTSEEALSDKFPAEVICFTKDGKIIFNGVEFSGGGSGGGSVTPIEPTEPTLTYVDRGVWAKGAKYYCETENPETGVLETSDVWYYGCKYRCCKNLTKTPPAWNNTDWMFLEGNSTFAVDFKEPESIVDINKIDITLTIVATMYNQDVTADINDDDIVWTRYSEDAEGSERVESDKIWNSKHDETGKSLHLTKEDMGINGYMPNVIRFTATVTLRDGKDAAASTAKVSYEC